MPLIAGAAVVAPGGVVTGTGLARAIAEACSTSAPPGSPAEVSLQQFSNLLAAAIVEHIVANAQVTVALGIPVATAGSAAAQTGTTTAPGTGTVL